MELEAGDGELSLASTHYQPLHDHTDARPHHNKPAAALGLATVLVVACVVAGVAGAGSWNGGPSGGAGVFLVKDTIKVAGGPAVIWPPPKSAAGADDADYPGSALTGCARKGLMLQNAGTKMCLDANDGVHEDYLDDEDGNLQDVPTPTVARVAHATKDFKLEQSDCRDDGATQVWNLYHTSGLHPADPAGFDRCLEVEGELLRQAGSSSDAMPVYVLRPDSDELCPSVWQLTDQGTVQLTFSTQLPGSGVPSVAICLHAADQQSGGWFGPALPSLVEARPCVAGEGRQQWAPRVPSASSTAVPSCAAAEVPLSPSVADETAAEAALAVVAEAALLAQAKAQCEAEAARGALPSTAGGAAACSTAERKVLDLSEDLGAGAAVLGLHGGQQSLTIELWFRAERRERWQYLVDARAGPRQLPKMVAGTDTGNWFLAFAYHGPALGFIGQGYHELNFADQLKLRLQQADEPTEQEKKLGAVRDPRDGAWHHVAVTAQRGALRLYLDGVLAKSGSFRGKVLGLIPVPDSMGGCVLWTGSPLIIGGRRDLGTKYVNTEVEGLGGHVAEVRLWSTARSTVQLTQARFRCMEVDQPDASSLDDGSSMDSVAANAARAGESPSTSGLLGYWRFSSGDRGCGASEARDALGVSHARLLGGAFLRNASLAVGDVQQLSALGAGVLAAPVAGQCALAQWQAADVRASPLGGQTSEADLDAAHSANRTLLERVKDDVEQALRTAMQSVEQHYLQQWNVCQQQAQSGAQQARELPQAIWNFTESTLRQTQSELQGRLQHGATVLQQQSATLNADLVRLRRSNADIAASAGDLDQDSVMRWLQTTDTGRLLLQVATVGAELPQTSTNLTRALQFLQSVLGEADALTNSSSALIHGADMALNVQRSVKSWISELAVVSGDTGGSVDATRYSLNQLFKLLEDTVGDRTVGVLTRAVAASLDAPQQLRAALEFISTIKSQVASLKAKLANVETSTVSVITEIITDMLWQLHALVAQAEEQSSVLGAIQSGWDHFTQGDATVDLDAIGHAVHAFEPSMLPSTVNQTMQGTAQLVKAARSLLGNVAASLRQAAAQALHSLANSAHAALDVVRGDATLLRTALQDALQWVQDDILVQQNAEAQARAVDALTPLLMKQLNRTVDSTTGPMRQAALWALSLGQLPTVLCKAQHYWSTLRELLDSVLQGDAATQQQLLVLLQTLIRHWADEIAGSVTDVSAGQQLITGFLQRNDATRALDVLVSHALDAQKLFEDSKSASDAVSQQLQTLQGDVTAQLQALLPTLQGGMEEHIKAVNSSLRQAWRDCATLASPDNLMHELQQQEQNVLAAAVSPVADALSEAAERLHLVHGSIAPQLSALMSGQVQFQEALDGLLNDVLKTQAAEHPAFVPFVQVAQDMSRATLQWNNLTQLSDFALRSFLSHAAPAALSYEPQYALLRPLVRLLDFLARAALDTCSTDVADPMLDCLLSFFRTHRSDFDLYPQLHLDPHNPRAKLVLAFTPTGAKEEIEFIVNGRHVEEHSVPSDAAGRRRLLHTVLGGRTAHSEAVDHAVVQVQVPVPVPRRRADGIDGIWSSKEALHEQVHKLVQFFADSLKSGASCTSLGFSSPKATLGCLQTALTHGHFKLSARLALGTPVYLMLGVAPAVPGKASSAAPFEFKMEIAQGSSFAAQLLKLFVFLLQHQTAAAASGGAPARQPPAWEVWRRVDWSSFHSSPELSLLPPMFKLHLRDVQHPADPSYGAELQFTLVGAVFGAIAKVAGEYPQTVGLLQYVERVAVQQCATNTTVLCVMGALKHFRLSAQLDATPLDPGLKLHVTHQQSPQVYDYEVTVSSALKGPLGFLVRMVPFVSKIEKYTY